MICGVPLSDRALPPEQGWPVTGLVLLVSAPLPAVMPGSVPGVVGDTGVSIGGGTISGALGVLGLKIGGGGGGGANAPTCATAVAAPAKTGMAADAANQ
jgi:hypothetical protein